MKRAQLGMTTLEIMVTLAIAGVFASMAVLNMDVVKRRQAERNALREISVLANQARAMARTSQFPVRLSVVTNTAGRTTIRWEQLPCDNADRWGRSCPAQECYTNACGQGNCKCIDQGEAISVPPTLNVAALKGLCWLGQGGVPRYQASGTSPTCQSEGPPPPLPLQILQRSNIDQPYRVDHVLEVNALTGRPRMVDCTSASAQSTDPACPR